MSVPQIKLWTIQAWPAWDGLQQSGVLRADSAHATDGFNLAYRWMAAQMRQRLRQPAKYRSLPLWAWAQWRDAATARPDLRYRGHLPTGMPGVRLQITLPADQVLLSDFGLWHHVLNGYYLARSAAEDENFNRKVTQAGLGGFVGGRLPHRELRREMEHSWTRIFELGGRRARTRRAIQATFWQLPLEAVQAVDEFVAR